MLSSRFSSYRCSYFRISAIYINCARPSGKLKRKANLVPSLIKLSLLLPSLRVERQQNSTVFHGSTSSPWPIEILTVFCYFAYNSLPIFIFVFFFSGCRCRTARIVHCLIFHQTRNTQCYQELLW